MNYFIELSYVLTLLLGVASFTIQITVRKKNLTTTSTILRCGSTTVFLLLVMVFNLCEFLIIYLDGEADINIISWIYVLENVLELGVAYFMICMERDYAEKKSPKWLDMVFIITAMIIIYGDSVYTLGPLFKSEKVYVTVMIILNMVPIVLLTVFGLKYWISSLRIKERSSTDMYMLVCNITCIVLCIISTVSIIDSRTTKDLIQYDRETYLLFWLVFNTINFVFIWQFCAVDERNDTERIQSIEERLSVIINKYGLSHREGEIAEQLLRGKNNKEMAASLYLSPNTIKVHASNLYRKLGASNRIQAVQVLRGEEITNNQSVQETEEE